MILSLNNDNSLTNFSDIPGSSATPRRIISGKDSKDKGKIILYGLYEFLSLYVSSKYSVANHAF